jgi:hypothetical protein
MNKMLYVIALEKDNYFVYYSDTESHMNVMKEIEYMFEFPKLYIPIKIIETTWTLDVFEIDKYVKKYMMIYGIDHVRGGSYLSNILPDFQKKSLQKELEYLYKYQIISGEENIYPYCHDFIGAVADINGVKYGESSNDLYQHEKIRQFIYQTTGLNNEGGKFFNAEILDVIIPYYEKKKVISNKLNTFLAGGSVDSKIKELKTLCKMIHSELITRLEKKPYLVVSYDNYKQMMDCIHYVISLAKKNESSKYDEYIENTSIEKIYFHHPQFLLDKLVLHKTATPTDIKQATEFITIIEGWCYWAINTIECLLFDLKQMPENIEWKHDIIMYSLDNCEFC